MSNQAKIEYKTSSLNQTQEIENEDEVKKTSEKDIEFEAPKLFVTGVQSSGKSTLVNFLVGHPVTPSSHLQCTKRPIVFHLDPENKEPCIIKDWFNVDKEDGFSEYKVQLREVTNKITSIMIETNEFKKEPIDVVIPSQKKIKLVDFPGIDIKNFDNIVDTINEYKSINDKLLFVSRMSDDPSVIFETTELSRLIEKTKLNCIVVLTKVDLFIDNWKRDGLTLEHILSETKIAVDAKPHFVVLNPNKIETRQTQTINYISNLEKAEEDFWQENKVNTSKNPVIGLKNLQKNVFAEYNAMFDEYMQKIRSIIEVKLNRLNNKILDLEKQRDLITFDKIDDDMLNSIKKLILMHTTHHCDHSVVMGDPSVLSNIEEVKGEFKLGSRWGLALYRTLLSTFMETCKNIQFKDLIDDDMKDNIIESGVYGKKDYNHLLSTIVSNYFGLLTNQVDKFMELLKAVMSSQIQSYSKQLDTISSDTIAAILCAIFSIITDNLKGMIHQDIERYSRFSPADLLLNEEKYKEGISESNWEEYIQSHLEKIMMRFVNHIEVIFYSDLLSLFEKEQGLRLTSLVNQFGSNEKITEQINKDISKTIAEKEILFEHIK